MFVLSNCHLAHHNRPKLTRDQFRYGMRCRAQKMVRDIAARKSEACTAVATSFRSANGDIVHDIAANNGGDNNSLYSEKSPKLSCIRYTPTQGRDASTQTSATDISAVVCKITSDSEEPMVVSPTVAISPSSPTMLMLPPPPDTAAVSRQSTAAKKNHHINKPLLRQSSEEAVCQTDTQFDSTAGMHFKGKMPFIMRTEWV